MAKLKNPLLSMGAEGTIGDAITFQKRGQATIVREKPIPAYRRTLPQVYQRWLYEDYAYLWTQQTAVIKRQCAATGSRFHLTGFQYWMKLMLATLPDITGMWHLDERTGAIAKDFSKNSNNGTIYGATPTVGIIDYALSFDGLNDYVACPPILTNWNTNWTIEIRASLSTDIPTWGGLLGNRFGTGAANWVTLGWIGTQIAAEFGPIGSLKYLYSWWDARGQGWKTYHLRKTGLTVALFINAIASGTVTLNGNNLGGNTNNVYFGRWFSANLIWKGPIDEAIIYNRTLDATEMLRHSKRRYPP